MRKKIFLFLAIILLSACGVTKVFKLFKIIKSGQVEQKHFKYEIPFEYKDGVITLKAKINDLWEEDFILDSGAPVCVISDSILKATRLKKIVDYETTDVNSKTKTTGWYIADSVRINKLGFTKIGAVNLDFGNSAGMCIVKGGIIGMNMLDKCVSHIDYPNKKIILASSLDSIPNVKGRGIRIPISRDKAGYMYIKAEFNEQRTEQLLFDLGYANGFISVPMKAFSNYTNSNKIIKSYGNGNGGAFSISQDTVYTARVKSLSMQNIYFPDAAITSSKNDAFSLGNEIIKYFYLTLNLKDNEMYLTPIAGKEFLQHFFTFGFEFDYKGEQLTIGTLDQNGPAEKAGLLLNDTVLSVNHRKINFKDYCDFIMSGSELLKNVDSVVVLKIKRNGIEKIVSLQKEKML